MQPIPKRFSSIQGLGNTVEYFPLKHRFLMRAGNILLGILCLLAGLFAIGLTTVQGFLRYYYHGPAVVLRGVLAPVILGILLIALGIYGLASGARRWKKGAVLFEHGIAVQGNGPIETSSWKDLASLRMAVSRKVFAGIPSGTDQKFTLTCKDGRRLSIDGELAGAASLMDQVRARMLPVLYETYAPRFESGQDFAFGSIVIHKELGIRIKKRRLPWETLQKAAIQNGELRLLAADSGGKSSVTRIPVAEIPNLDLLMVFLHQARPDF